MHTGSVSGKYAANSGVSPISQHLVLFILFDLLLELPFTWITWSVSDDQNLKKQNKTKQNKQPLFETRLELRYDHPFTTVRRIVIVNCNFCQCLFFPFVSGRTFCVQPRHPRWRSFHFPNWKNSSGKFHSFRLFFVLIYTLNQWYCKVF